MNALNTNVYSTQSGFFQAVKNAKVKMKAIDRRHNSTGRGMGLETTKTPGVSGSASPGISIIEAMGGTDSIAHIP